MNGDDIDMRMFAQRVGASVTYAAGSIVFNKGDPGSCMYVVQSGVIEMVIGDKVIEVCGANEAIGFMSMIDGAAEKLDRARQGGVRALPDRSAQVPLHGRRGAELRALRHGRDGAAHPRHGPGDVTIADAARSGGLRQEGVAHRPFVPLAAGRTRARIFCSRMRKQRADLALDAAVDLASRRWADEDQMFHDGLHWRT